MTTVHIIGLGSVSLYAPIIPGGNFTWSEATHGGSRLPATEEISKNIVTYARSLQSARDEIGLPFHITSWYRPPAVNAAVGGAPGSYHLTGLASDQWVEGFTGLRLAGYLYWWPGGMGCYPNMPRIIHLDLGPKRRWGI
jgi:uncharacterized protein YcbK (DUF882 family)